MRGAICFRKHARACSIAVEVGAMKDLDEAILDEYLASIRKKVDASGGKDLACLSAEERTAVIGHRVALELSNGGLEQFFVNPAGDHWREAILAIKALGADKLGQIFEKALEVFPNSSPSEKQATRCKQLAAAGTSGSELLWGLTGKYYALQEKSARHCLYQRLTAFAIKQMQKG